MAHRTYETSKIRVFWDSELCIHTGICLRLLPGVFDVDRRPWVDIEGAEADAIAEAIERCPSGALRYERLDDAPQEEPEHPTVAVPQPHGPLWMRGDIEVRDREGNLLAKGTRMTLCRCGASRNQPFCDLSHRSIGFRDNVAEIESTRAEASSPGAIKPPQRG